MLLQIDPMIEEIIKWARPNIVYLVNEKHQQESHQNFCLGFMKTFFS